ncbi:hypothetical protein H5410_013271, partial [Solanum commersonii]
LPLSQEIENPSSFNFSIPLQEEFLSTPVCEVVASHTLPSGVVLPCSPTLFLSGEKSQNSEAQSVVKPSTDLPTEEVEVFSWAGPESNILAIVAELVAVQSLASLRGDVQPTLLEQELRSPKQVPNSVQHVFDQTPKSFDIASEKEEEEEVPLKSSSVDLEGVNIVPDTNLNNKPTEFTKERTRKGKEKMVESHTKGDKKKYGTKSEMQKVMGSAIAANVIQIERARKRRREGHLPEEPTSTPLPIGSRDTESDDVVAHVAKRRKKVEFKRVKSKRGHRSMKKSHMKKERVSKKVTEKSKSIKDQFLVFKTS